VSGHQVRVSRQELAPLELEAVERAYVLAIVGKNERGITLNLKAPVVINLDRRIGHQVVASGDLPLQYELNPSASHWKKAA
jgi:flagellar assembly factor FliW